ncbi:UDP-glucose 4-epimerase GalE [Pseudoalteromonas tunicata]|jgi:UDP-glucose 4-epimerase|uniref:UDP-glucose 4-epimerase n=1 Tax=Pseudoalteromonas tunicata D2 TaxID=87626 RepID=A4CBY1_9GAMM|nr:UDP-glucose 4-epimerase GalE [Pseudoalteromonas tunicata]ATC94418.1 UDP-glucose 4-epimerase [Pseudoalteromonas tunicata]AXT30151.1 UDP-glucose 4-epimerase GalE [Pseudoalteromonas tunicata]EAR27868.1 UDP-glucose-4-epimerase [Pseudoalteromonas tunicata D2]
MAVLVTGGNGYIGSHTVVELLNLGHEVVIFDNLSNSNRAVLERIETITAKKPHFILGDIRDSQALAQVFNDFSIDAVIHFAGLKAVGESVAMPLSYYDNNVCGSLCLLKAMNDANVKKIIFSSSATVYGSPERLPIDEQCALRTTNPYGANKLQVEQMLSDLCQSDANWSVVALRYFNPVGAHKSGLIGESPNGIPNNLLPYVTQTALKIRKQLSIFGGDYDTADGTGVRDYIHVVDLALGHIKALDLVAAQTGFEPINLGTGIGYSVLDIVRSFEAVNQIAVPYEIVARRPGDIATCYADPKKAKDILGWQAEQTLDDMMKDAWHWQSNNPKGYDD